MPTCWQFPAVGHQLHLALPLPDPLLLQLLGFHLPCSPLSPSAVDCQALPCYLLPSLSLLFSDFHLPGSLTGCPPPPPGRSPTSLFFKTPVANWELLLLQTGSSCSCSGIEKTFFHFMSRIPNRPIRLCWSESIFCELLCPFKGLHCETGQTFLFLGHGSKKAFCNSITFPIHQHRLYNIYTGKYCQMFKK